MAGIAGWRHGLLVVASLACFATAGMTTRRLEALAPAATADRELMYFPSGKLLDVLCFGNATLAADLVWLRGLQYYGHHRLTDGRFDHIGHIFDVATSLDPHFTNAYVFGGLVLAAEGRDVEGGIRFMRRGLAENPDSYELAFEIGFLYHVGLRDFGHAAYFYRRALRHPDCPEHVRRFAAYACEKIALNDEAVELWQEILRTSTQPAMRRLAEERIAMIEGVLDRGGDAREEAD
ncbi:MAG: hypothetical protein PVF43_01490 [Candidatus Eiseniibacteriota bacterium]|jgi:hypothetical protein